MAPTGEQQDTQANSFFFLKIFLFTYLTERQPAREGTQAGEEEAGFPAEQGARGRARSQDAGIMT